MPMPNSIAHTIIGPCSLGQNRTDYLLLNRTFLFVANRERLGTAQGLVKIGGVMCLFWPDLQVLRALQTPLLRWSKTMRCKDEVWAFDAGLARFPGCR